MSLFDSNCMLGRRSIHTPLDVPTTREALLAEMDRLGIAESLVHGGMAVDGHPADGNARLMREIAGQPRLHPCWVILPSCGEMLPPSELTASMRVQGVRAVRMYPRRHRFVFSVTNLGDVLHALSAARIPLFLDYEIGHWAEEKVDWEGLDQICSAFPELPIVVVGEGVGAPRRLFPFWEKHRNLILETSYYQVHQGLSDIVRRFGAGRLLFGTGLPVRAPGPALAQLRHDFLNDEDRRAIGGGNLRRLLERAHNGTLAALTPQDPSAARVSAVELPSHPILDAHTHLGTWFSTYVHAGDANGLKRSMDRLGIQAMALIAFDAIGPDMEGGNDQSAAAMRAHPGRFLGYATVDPNRPGDMRRELERCFGPLGFHAIKFHCDTHGYPADAANFRPALEYADAHGLCVLIHGAVTAAMLEAWPRAQFLTAHAGGWNGRGTSDAIALAKRYPNLHLDLAASAVFNGALERMVAEVGAERIVHGSDAPLMDAAYQLGRVLAARLSPAQKRLILHDNAARLMRLAG